MFDLKFLQYLSWIHFKHDWRNNSFVQKLRFDEYIFSYLPLGNVSFYCKQNTNKTTVQIKRTEDLIQQYKPRWLPGTQTSISGEIL